MNTRRWLLVLALLLSVPSQAAEKPDDLSARFADLLKKLDDDEYQVRQDAAKMLAELPGEAHVLAVEALARKTLGPEAKVRLTEVLPALALKARHLARAKEDAERLNWNKRTLREAYEKAGTKDPKWDADACEALDVTALLWSHPLDLAGNEEDRILASCEKAFRAGCRDPLILYVRARMKYAITDTPYQQVATMHVEAAQGMREAKYPAVRRAYAIMRGANYRWNMVRNKTDVLKKEVQDLIDAACEAMPDLLRDADMPADQKIDFLEGLVSALANVMGDRGAAYEKLRPAFEAALPASSNIGLVTKGSVYVSWAWDARGGGYANTVTDDGWKKMKERLAVAKEALEEAYKIDPHTPDAALAMFSVELGQGNGRESMEVWWKRAMEADPDCFRACGHKLYYLEPKWYGSREEMVAFGHQCLETGNWPARLPFILVDAHLKASGYEDSGAYFAQPEVWKDIQAVYVPYLEKFPERHHDRSTYAKIACWAGQWKVADEQFKKLGNNARMNVFGRRANYNKMKQDAAAKAAQQ